MLLNPYLFQDESDKKTISDESIKNAGILYRKRKIYILKKYAIKCFESGNIFDSYSMNTVIVVNISRSKDNISGNYKCIKSVYSFTYAGTNSDVISEFKNARLMLRYCITSGYECDESYREGKYIDSTYYNDLGITFGYDENDDPVEINIDDMCCCDDDMEDLNKEKLHIPDPRYYTKEQYEIDTGLETEFVLMKNRFYDAIDLLDDTTDVYVVEEKDIDKMNHTECRDINGEITPVKDPQMIYELTEIIKDAQLIPFDMFLLNSKSCFTSYKFIYDSKSGFNIKDINSDRNIIKSRNSDYLNIIANKMNHFCNKIKNLYGDFRLYYYSSDISEHIELVFDNDKYHKISSTFDKNAMFERLMVYVTDKYREYIERPLINIDDYYFV